MIPINQQQQQSASSSSPSSVQATSQNVLASPKRSLPMDFVADNVKRMFPCVANEDEHVQLCCQFLNGTSDLFNDEFNNPSEPSTPNSGPPSPSGNRRLSVKRRKNSKLGHKVDGNLVRGDVESEESIHVFQDASPADNENGHSKSATTKKTPVLNQQEQFDLVQSSISIHLQSLQDEVEKAQVNGSLVSNKSRTNSEDLTGRALQEAVLAHLHQIFRDLNKVKRFLTFTANRNRRKSSQGEEPATPNSPLTPVSSGLYNSNVDRLLQNRYLVLQLLHLECTILRYLRLLEQSLNREADAILSSDEFAPLQLKLEDVCRSYYALLTKLSYEPTFLKIVSLIHRITPTNGACLLLILFRSLVARGEEPKQDDDSYMFDQEEKAILTVTQEDENCRPDIKLVDDKTGANNTNNNKINVPTKPGIANNRTIVFILTYVQSLAKNDIFASPSASSPDKRTKTEQMLDMVESMRRKSVSDDSNCSLVAVCCEVLDYFCSISPVSNYPLKSTVRQHAIETLAHLCLSKDGLYDAVKMGATLHRKLIGLLSQCAVVHSKLVSGKSFLTLLHSTPSSVPSANGKPTKCNITEYKLYLSILRDIYGLLSILISLTEFKSGREYLLFHNVATSLYEMFMLPFIATLNGTESADPRHLMSDCNEPRAVHIDDRAEAYKRLRAMFATDQKIQRYLDRIVGIASIIVQRLLDPMIIPLEHAHNPFSFDLPVQSPSSDPDQFAPIDSSSPNDSAEKTFEKFDNSDLDEDENNEDEYDSEEEEDSFVHNSDSSNDHIRQQDSFELGPVKGRNMPSAEITAEQDEAKLVQSYLRFFPEAKHFNWNSINTGTNGSLENILNCNCDINVEHFIERSEPSQSPTALPISIPPLKFDWAQEYEKQSRSTWSVMPCQSLALPELNFVNAISERNELPQPMTYPFLEKQVRRKNLHHVKMLDHVKERLSTTLENKPTYITVYDIENNQQAATGDYLQFESRFECGNLRRALVKQSPANCDEEEYLLLLHSDINSTIHTQWFYFSVRGMRPGKRYRFKIINLQKKSILYNSGQQPLFYSKCEFERSRQMWQRIGVDESQHNVVAYYRNHYARSNSVAGLFADKPFYTLEFTFVFPHANDQCYFTYNIPFSYTFLRTNIAYWQRLVQHHNQHCNSETAIFFDTQNLCSSLKGNDLPVMTITSASGNGKCKPHYMLLTARVHPSESNSSWILKGFVDFLLNQSADQEVEQQRLKLLQNYVFKIVPMLNPDGVINGCTRTDLQRDDLNRFWHDPKPLLHPTIYHSKMLLKCLHHFSSGRNPVAFVDLHGHSRRKNIFSYSCSPLLSWKKADRMQYRKQTSQNHFCVCPPRLNSDCQLKNQMKQLKQISESKGNANSAENTFYLMPPFVTLPVLLHLQRAPSFNLENCSFVVQKDREHTARVVGWREFGISLTYTVECTASGCNEGPHAGMHLAIGHMEEMGRFIAGSFGFLDFLYCANRHVPIIAMPKSAALNGALHQQATTSPIHHPGNDDFLKNLLIKCTKRYSRPSGDQYSLQMRKLIQMYPDLNMLSGSVASSSSDSSQYSSATSLLTNSQPSTPSKKNPVINIL